MEYSLSLQMSSERTAAGQEQQFSHPQPHHLLHGVRKPPAKPWRRPDLPPPPKVYRVDPHGFRKLVQRLTGRPQSAAWPMRDSAPAPPPIQVEKRTMPVQPQFQQHPLPVAASEQMGLLSPSFYSSYCSFPLLSPGSMAGLES